MSILAPILVIFGFIALVGGAELLVRGASRLALAFGISPLVVGLTVVAFGTSAPEAAVGVFSAATGQAGIAVGNVIGSNIFNILFVLGLAAMVAPLIVAQQLVRLEVPIMIGASCLLFALSLDGQIGRLDGAILFCGVIIFTVWAIRRSRREGGEVKKEYESEFGPKDSDEEGSSIARDIALAVTGMVLLVVGSQFLVTGAVDIANFLGVSEVIIGLTIISIGTSLPEVATSVLASLRNERDIAVGNAIGSNLFNILAVFGLTGLIAPAGITIPATVLWFDMPIMIAVAIATLPIFFSGHLIRRWEGSLMFSYYWLYLAFLTMTVLSYPGLVIFSQFLTLFVLPLTAATLVFSAWRAWRAPA